MMNGMKIDFNGLLYALSYALDCVEGELLGVSTGHAKRVAYMSVRMAEALGMHRQELSDLAACAVLHDNALTQYIAEEYNHPVSEKEACAITPGQLGIHCTLGEKNIREFPFHTDVTGAILYHHENADGSGPFHKKTGQVHPFAEIIHLCDLLDSAVHMGQNTADLYTRTERYLKQNENSLFNPLYIRIFLTAFQQEECMQIGSGRIDELLWQHVPEGMTFYTYGQLKAVMDIFAVITDYKSTFTGLHSLGVAKKVQRLAQYRGMDEDTVQQLYLAGALHDIGKMAVHNDILEKPDRLTGNEYLNMKNHALYSYQILSQIKGFEEIAHWAALHHEKLDGSGYPFGKTAEELDEKDRMMACIDIYQALIEPRPYKAGMPHEEALAILNTLAEQGKLDGSIIIDIAALFGRNDEHGMNGFRDRKK